MNDCCACWCGQVTPDDSSDATTRGEAVQDFVSSPQASGRSATDSNVQRLLHSYLCTGSQAW